MSVSRMRLRIGGDTTRRFRSRGDHGVARAEKQGTGAPQTRRALPDAAVQSISGGDINPGAAHSDVAERSEAGGWRLITPSTPSPWNFRPDSVELFTRVRLETCEPPRRRSDSLSCSPPPAGFFCPQRSARIAATRRHTRPHVPIRRGVGFGNPSTSSDSKRTQR